MFDKFREKIATPANVFRSVFQLNFILISTIVTVHCNNV